MPPKAKFTREQIIHAALDLVRAEGPGALTARSLGAALGSSARPVFTVFSSMDEVLAEVMAAAKRLYNEYVDAGLTQREFPVFKGVGMQYIRFACTEPKLFQMLFMTEQEHRPAVSQVLPVIDDNYPKIRASIENYYSMSPEEADWLYRHLWIYTHGIAVLCATNLCTFTREEMGGMMTEIRDALLQKGISHD